MTSDLSPGSPAAREPGSQPDLNEFWAAYVPRLRRYAAHLLTQLRIPDGRLDVGDVEQSVYETLLTNWDTVSNPVGYVRGQVKAVVFGQLRAEKRYGASLDLLQEAGAELSDDAPLAEDALIEREEQARLAAALPAALAQLTDPQREAVRLTTEQGLTREQAAEQMNLKAGTVHSHHGRAMAKLRKSLLVAGVIAVSYAAIYAAISALIRSREAVIMIAATAAYLGAIQAIAWLRKHNRRPVPAGASRPLQLRGRIQKVLRSPLLRPGITAVLSAPFVIPLLRDPSTEATGVVAGVVAAVYRYPAGWLAAGLRHLFAVDPSDTDPDYRH